MNSLAQGQGVRLNVLPPFEKGRGLPAQKFQGLALPG